MSYASRGAIDELLASGYDHTFDQTRPLDRLAGAQVVYSFDLKSATDSLVFLFRIMTYLFLIGLLPALACNIDQVPIPVLSSMLCCRSASRFALPPYYDILVCRTGSPFTFRNRPY